jgi:NADPH:quinone reductase-like Zn-dependent oxidoreductase
MSIPDTQRAMVMNAQGAPPELDERAVATPGEGEVLVKVNASSVNYHDAGNLAGLMPGPWPRIPMSDGAGTVAAVGSGVTDFSIGDRVMGAFYPRWLDGPPTPERRAELPGDTGDGWLQQYRVAKVSALVATPGHLTDVEAATLPCAGVTAWNALVAGNIAPGDVVVTQGTGGVSLFAAQFAHALGATVIMTSSSDDKLQIGSRLGATHLINYRTTPDWEQEVKRLTDGRGADLIVDVGGAQTLARSVRATRMAGTVTVTGVLTGFDSAPIPIADVLFKSIRVIGVTVGSVRSFVDLCEMVSRTGIRPNVSHVFDWTELTEAVRVLGAGEHIGKIALTIEQAD